jgi:very-short-patch-repair endonuclease
MYNNHFYNKNLKQFARELRSETVSRAEKRIWKALLSRKQTGERFLRQRPIKNFIVDFFCPELKLIIEIDGNSHYHKPDYDAFRQRQLEELGFLIVRFSEGDVLSNLDKVSNKITHCILP